MPNSPYTDPSLHCPNQAQWLRYRRGQSSPLETRAIEEHFTNCALCSEAINTIMSTEADVLEAQWASLNNTTHTIASPTILPTETQKSKTIIQFLSPWLVAAVISGVVVGAYFIYQQSHQANQGQLAQNTPTYKQTQAPPSSTATPLNESIPASSEKTNNEPGLPSNNTIASKKNIESASPAATVKATTPLPRLTDQSNTVLANNETYALTENVRAAQADEAVSFQQTEAPKSVEPNSNKAPTITAAAAKETTVAKAYKKEKNLRLTEKKDVQTMTDARTPSGSELYLNEEYSEAIPRLLDAIKNQSPYPMEAIFLADAYIKTGNKQAAETMLLKVIKENGPFAKKAQQMLDLIQ